MALAWCGEVRWGEVRFGGLVPVGFGSVLVRFRFGYVLCHVMFGSFSVLSCSVLFDCQAAMLACVRARCLFLFGFASLADGEVLMATCYIIMQVPSNNELVDPPSGVTGVLDEVSEDRPNVIPPSSPRCLPGRGKPDVLRPGIVGM